jgi:uncharacterized protein
MKLSMYQASVPRFVNALTNLSAILKKAEAHAEAKKIEPSVLLHARLFPDMYALTKQVQIACDNAKGPVARLAGVEVPKHEDTETTFAELQARITKTIAFIQSIKPEQIDGSDDKDILLKLGTEEMPFKGMQYLLGFAYPNFFFHVVTAYGILRHSGADVGKRDYIGNPFA